MNVVWKNIGRPFSLYSVSTNGLVRNDKTGYVFNNLSTIGGYIRARIVNDNGEVFNALVHRLVAQAFLPNTENKACVDHINRNRSDNRMENLRWVNARENMSNREHRSCKQRSVKQMTKDGEVIAIYSRLCDAPFPHNNISSACRKRIKSAYGYIWEYVERSLLPGEQFKKISFSGENILISNMGRVKMPSGIITYGNVSSGGYAMVSVGGKSIVLHKLLVKCFCDKYEDNMVVHHIDGNKTNNKLSNLSVVTQSENTLYTHQKTGRKVPDGFIRPVQSIDANGTRVVYDSIADAHRCTGISRGNICMACRGSRHNAGGRRWEYLYNVIALV